MIPYELSRDVVTPLAAVPLELEAIVAVEEPAEAKPDEELSEKARANLFFKEYRN